MLQNWARSGLSLLILGVVAFAGCLAIVQIAGDPRAYDYQGQYAENAATGQELAKDGTGANRRPPSDQSICRHAKTEKEYELCQAWRAAEGAEQAASTAWLQLIVSIGGLVGLIYTVRYTARAAKAAAAAAAVAEKAFLSVERPIVFDDRFESGSHTNDTEQIVSVWFRGIVKNGGNTPALKVRSQVNLTCPTVDLPDDYAYADTESDRSDATSKIGPKQELEMPEITIPIDVAVAAYNGARKMFFYGWAEYDDMFEGTKRHRTEFCYKIDVFADPRLVGKSMHFNPYGQRYNGIDDDCMYQPDSPPPKKPANPAPGMAAR